jgi:hypothetical protein
MRWTILAAIPGVAMLAGVALATHPEPTRGQKFQFALVGSFFPCDNPNTTTQSPDHDLACTPAASDVFSACTLSPGWSGKLTASVMGNPATGNEDIKFAALAKGLNCEGEILCIALSFRTTTDDCPEGSCTIVDFQDVKLDAAPAPFGGCCVVANGVCKIKTTLLTAMPGRFTSGKVTNLQILGCGLETGLPGGPHPPDLACGILLK